VGINMKINLDEIQNRAFDMIDTYRSFVDYMALLKDRNYEESDEDEEMSLDPARPIYAEDEHEDTLVSEYMGETEYDDEDVEDMEYSCEDFPGRATFTRESLGDIDSERYYRGSSLGIPKRVAVKQNSDQGKLLPIRNGLFVDEGY